MKTSNIKARNTLSKGRFQKITIENSKGTKSFIGKIKKIGEKYIVFKDVHQGKEVRCLHNSVKSII